MEVVIVNPIAGRGFSRKAAQMLGDELRRRSIEHSMWETEHSDHATALAQRAVQEKATSVWVMGGDATLREAALGLLDSGVPLGILPCGTGNDLSRVLGVPMRRPVQAYDAQMGPPREIDVWQANDLIFLNVAGIGFDTETLIHTRKFKRLPGSMLPYLMGVIATVFTHRDVRLRLTIDGEEREGETLLFSLANGQYIGGGMRVAPDAITDDGLLDIVLIAPVPKRKIPFILPKFMRGEHIRLPIATVLRARDVRVHSDEEVFFQIDGELFPATDLHFRKSDRRLLLRGLTRP